ncbi:MAG: hypothetical protein OEQ53_02985 [Saprospiraceae bacterium]|nr:hypothetical protein [Saprospiraceae bacterium]
MKAKSTKFRFLYLLVLNFFLSGCSKDGLWIRVENDSNLMFHQVRVSPDVSETMFGDLNSGEISIYKPFKIAYRYAQIKVIIEGEEFLLQPIDYVGETPLEEGNYTYIIGVADLNSLYGLTLDLRKD